jgi:hypothetical protein
MAQGLFLHGQRMIEGGTVLSGRGIRHLPASRGCVLQVDGCRSRGVPPVAVGVVKILSSLLSARNAVADVCGPSDAGPDSVPGLIHSQLKG